MALQHRRPGWRAGLLVLGQRLGGGGRSAHVERPRLIDDEPGYYRGPGWYRTSLRMDQRYNKGERLFLYFEGANQVADVYVEGVRVGGHVGGYQAFSVEVTEQLRGVRPGRDAVIAVRVDNSYNADVPPLTADFTFYGGIYRNVWLVVTPAVHLDLLDHASPGVYVDTPDASAASATVRVRSRVVNDSDDAATVDVQSFVLAADGSTVTSTLSSVRVGSRASTVVTQTVTVPKPRLWSPESPYLYSVRTVVGTGPQADRVDVPLGVRWFKADRNGFFLNGKAYPLRERTATRTSSGRATLCRTRSTAATCRSSRLWAPTSYAWRTTRSPPRSQGGRRARPDPVGRGTARQHGDDERGLHRQQPRYAARDDPPALQPPQHRLLGLHE